MRIAQNIDVLIRKDGTVISTINGAKKTEVDPARIADLTIIYEEAKKLASANREAWLDGEIANGKFTTIFAVGSKSCADFIEPESVFEVMNEALQGLMDFFKEFEFEPNFRFVNTLSHALVKSSDDALAYVNSYFELIDSAYKNEIVEKVKSQEFQLILDKLKSVAPTKSVNNRFKLYYGSQGTGKTTIGQQESNGRCVVCNASMLPQDLMEDFGFNAGDPALNHSMLWDCMEQGVPLVLDEINLLPFDSLRFLQGILDGKKEFNYKNQVVHINDGFCVIGTMNLAVNGMVYALPEPLVDRCMEMKKFTLTASDLVGAII